MAKALGRFRCTDAMGAYRSTRVRDQEPEEEAEGGRLVCRVIEDARGGLHITDAGRLRLRARRSKDGVLEIRHHDPDDKDEEQTNDEAAEAPAANGDPLEQVVGYYPAGGNGDPAKAAKGSTGDAMARFQRTQKPEHHMAGLTAYQARLDAFYRR